MGVNILRIVISLNGTLQPFYNSETTSQIRDESLAALTRKTADFGLLLFTQPASWSVQWKDSRAQLGPLDENEVAGSKGTGEHHRDLVVFPGLEKIAVEEQTGRFKRTPVTVLRAEIDRNVEIGVSHRIPRSVSIGVAK